MISELRKERAIQAIAYMETGMSQSDVGKKWNVSSSEVAGYIRDYRKHQSENIVRDFPRFVRFDKEGKPKRTGLRVELPIYGIAPNITEDVLIDIGDTHFPEANYPFLDGLLGVAKEAKRRYGRVALNICGDLMSQNAVSPHPPTDRPMALDNELDVAAAWLQEALRIFDTAKLEAGNHCKWLNKFTEGQLGLGSLWGLLAEKIRSGKLETFTSTYATIDSGERRWLTTHTVQFQQQGKVARVLSEKHQIDTLTHHEHQVARGRDHFNRFNWVNVGGGFDYNLQLYPHQYTTTKPFMQNSFVLLIKGRVYEFAPYEAYGERWEDWGVDPSAMYAYEHQKRMINEFKITEKELSQMAESEAA